MPTLDEIKKQLNSLRGVEKFLGWKEIKELPKILWEDETLEKIVQGLYSNSNGILVATNKRVIFISKGLLWGQTVEDFSYDKISSIQYDIGLLFGEITFFTSGNKALIKQVMKDTCKDFCDYVRARISAPTKSAAVHDKPLPSEEDAVSKLERLAKLKEQGILTQEEFDVKKAQLMDKI